MNVRANVAASKPVSKPPFRAEHIGSLLRPPELMQARARFARGEIGQAELTAAEDKAIRGAIRLQEQLGFKFVTDGEFRRRSYHSFFYGELGKLRIDTIAGANAIGTEEDEKGGGGRGAQPVALIGSRVQWTHPINAGDTAFLKANSDRLPKITIPGPCALHFRGGDAAVTATAYKDVDLFWSDTVEAFGQELRALADAGCRYVQIDETAFAKFGDPDVQASLAARGDDWSKLIDTYIGVTNRILHAAPAGLHIGMHLCRGNRGGHWHAEGSYEEVAERLFNALEIPFYFLAAVRQFYAASLFAEAQIGGAGAGLDQSRRARGQDGAAAAPRRCHQIRGAGSPRDQPAMWLCQRRHRQSGDGRGATAQARTDLRHGARHLGRDISK
jgi:5-methyltetrahydropteroyltriglutamate--homocysteine methyltransferase